MNNFERIRNFTENEMIDFINLIIDEGNHMLADELDYAGVKYENDNYAEVKAWLALDTLERQKTD